MSTTYNVTTDSTFAMDNAEFDVSSGATLNLTGSSDTVLVESGINNVTLEGNDDTITGVGDTKASVNLFGTGNVVSLGDNANVWDGNDGTHMAYGDTITIGENSVCYLAFSSGATVNAGDGSFIEVAGAGGYIATDAVINANNSTISVGGSYLPSSAEVNGNGNQITLGQWTGNNATLNLSGSNNTITFDANTYSSYGGAEMIQTAAGDVVEEDATGAISISSGTGSYHFSINNGFVTLGFSDGNTVQISSVRSSSEGSGTVTDNQVTQLVSAMAAYSSGSSGVSSVLMAQNPADTSLFASSHH
jgi:hypothetical protein